jgi:hypothetical protein
MMAVKVREQASLLTETGVDRLVWIVVKAKPAQERRAKRELANQGFEVYLPLVRYQDKRGVTMAKPFLGRYHILDADRLPDRRQGCGHRQNQGLRVGGLRAVQSGLEGSGAGAGGRLS